MSHLAILMTTVLLAGSVLTAPAHAPAAPVSAERPASVRVVVDADALGDDAAAFFEERAYASVSAALEQAGYTVEDQVDADVTVRVRLSFYNADDLDYEVDVDISAGAELVRLETVACPQCVDADLLARVDELGADVAAGVARALEQVAEQPQTQPVGDGDGEPDEVAAVGWLGIAGGSIAGVGLGLTIAGAVQFSRGKVFDDPDLTPIERGFVDHRIDGGVLLGVGTVAIVAGAAMLIADVVTRSNERSQQRAHIAHPIIAPGIVGVGYIQRF